MIAIHQHPEWKLIEKWFLKRAEQAGVPPHQHVEHIQVPSAISDEIAKAGTELAKSLGESLSRLWANQDDKR